MKDEDIERAFFDHLKLKLPDLEIDRPGEFFSPAKFIKWIEPRLPDTDHPLQGAPGEEVSLAVFQVTCFLLKGAKGATFGDLSRLSDQVRGVVDVNEGGAAVEIKDGEGTVIGFFQFRGTRVTRQFDVDVEINETTITNVDVAIVRGTAIVSGDP